jgi:hypothetical protein
MAPTRFMRRKSKKTAAITKQQFTAMLNARRELKYNPFNDTNVVTDTGAVGVMSQHIILGDSSSTRDGAQIEVVRLQANLIVDCLVSTEFDNVRLIVFSDSQNNGSTPTVAEVISRADPNATYTRNVTVVKRFKILYDTHFALSATGSNRTVARKLDLKLDHTVNYLGDTDATASNGRGAIFYLIAGDNASPNESVYEFDWAFSYYDS